MSVGTTTDGEEDDFKETPSHKAVSADLPERTQAGLDCLSIAPRCSGRDKGTFSKATRDSRA